MRNRDHPGAGATPVLAPVTGADGPWRSRNRAGILDCFVGCPRRAPRNDASFESHVHAKDQRGVTLLELLVALAIVGLVLSIAVVNFRPGSAGIELRRTARELVSGLRQARSLAIAQNRTIAVSVDPAARGYAIDGRARALGGASSDLIVTQRAPTLANGQAPGARVAFRPDGSAAGARITLGGAAGQREIDIDAITGRVIARP